MTIARAVAGTIKRRALKPAATAAAAGLAVGLLSGTLGVGGGELRLPVLILLLGFTAKVAAPINLIVTVITLFGGIGARLYGHAFAQASDFAVEAVIVAAGAAPAAYFGARMLRRLNNRKLSRLVAVLLFGVGALMFAETLLDGEVAVTVQNPAARYVLCLALGVGVGIVVGLLGVGGNELMIPPLVVLFGLPIKEAGSVSLLISLPVVAVGMWRFHALSAFKHRDRDVMRTIVPLGLGSVVGALAGGLLAPIAPNSVLKFLLCAMLLFSAWRTWADDKSR